MTIKKRLSRHARLLTLAALSVAACDSSDETALGRGGAFDALTLGVSGGMPMPPHDGDECDVSYPETITVDAASATITWDLCRYDSSLPHTFVSRGSRVLDAAELETVRQALALVQVGNRGMCGADKATITLDVSAGGVQGRYVEDFYGCNPPIDGRTFVVNVDDLEYALWDLATKTET
jgi:hypothetical protein